MKKIFIILLLLISINGFGQGLIINEVSNGATGAQEFFELVVIGSTSNPLGNVDLGGWIIDDNNGDFEGSMSGVGIAAGHIRIKPGYLSSVKPGSIILIYNSDELNFIADPTDSNLDCIYIIPVNDISIEQNGSIPSTLNSNYLPSSYLSPGAWRPIGLANTGDAVQVRKPDGAFYHGFSYGDVLAPFPNFPTELGGGTSFNVTTGSGTGRMYYFNCGNFTSQTSFRRGSALTEETPGAPNNDLNTYFINAIRNGTYNYSDLSALSNCGTATSLTPCDFILPIEISKFEAKNNYTNNIIEWSIENIDDVYLVELQKSIDGINFETIFETYSTNENLYLDYYNNLESYYRLKITDKNSEVTLSKIIHLSQNESENTIIYPNPSRGKIYIKGENLEKLKIYNIYGKFISELEITNNQLELDLPNGLYSIQIKNNYYKIRILK